MMPIWAALLAIFALAALLLFVGWRVRTALATGFVTTRFGRWSRAEDGLDYWLFVIAVPAVALLTGLPLIALMCAYALGWRAH